MHVKQIVNSIFSSNTYILSDDNTGWVWLIDAGEIEGAVKTLSTGTTVKGVFITHTHFDHIYGINKLIDLFPCCIVYTSEYGKKGLISDKLNLSYYHQDPIIFMGSNIHILCETDRIELFENCHLETLETPGHNWSCLSFKVDNYLFTGDSFIPDVPVITKLKGGDKEASKISLQKITQAIFNNTIICPGHGKMKKV